ncbi:MAG: BREX system P-loop protein BrxC, partial [Chloroflexi bacterium]
METFRVLDREFAMQIKDIFQLEIKRRIPAVAKVDDITPETIQQEVGEYVVTSPIEEALVRFLEIYGDSRVKPTDQIGVWISGFFGSGKSHFAKMLNYLLKNPQIGGQPVVELFKARLDSQSAATHTIAGGLLLAQQIDNHVVMFNIEANRRNTSILSTLYSQYLAQERKMSGSIAVGRLELSLIRRGLYEAFKQKVEKELDETWETIREDFSMVRGAAVNALVAVAPEAYPTPQAADKAIDDLLAQENAVSISDVAKELVAYVDELRAAGNPERPPHLLFIIDEIGQFVGREKGRLLELQTIAEEFSTNGRGKLWLIVTSQQDLKGMIADIGSVQDEFGRIITRFDTRLALTNQDVELVLENRILKKNEAGKAELAQMFARYGGELSILGKIPGSSRELPALNKDSFPVTYPFLPYQLALIQDMIKAARTSGGSGFTLNTEARSMLGLCQGAITKNLLDGGVGRLIALDMVFNQVRLDLNQADVREIDKVPNQVTGSSGFDTRVVKALYLLQQVSYLPCTAEVIAHAIFQDIQAEHITELKKQVEEGLKRLEEAGFVIQKEAGIYEFLTGSKKTFEQEVNDIDAKKNDQRRTVRTRLTEVLREVGQVDFDKKRKFDTSVFADGERVNEGNALVLQVYSPLHLKLEDGLTLENIEMDSFTHTDTVYWLSKADEEVERLAVRLFKLLEALKPRQGQQSKTDEDKELIREKSKEISTLQQTIETRLRSALYNGTLVWSGDVQELDGKVTTLNPIFNKAMARVVPHIYPKFGMAGIRPDAKAIETVLTISDFALSTVEPGLALFDEKNHLNTHAQGIDEIMRELERRENKGLDKDGRSLLAHFEAPPYGWHPEVIRLMVAGMFRGGVLSIKSGNVVYDDASVPAARDRLTKANDFKSAEFLYDPDESVSLTERKTAQDAMYVMFGRSKTQDTASALAGYIHEDLEKLYAQVERLALQLGQVEYPLPASFKQSRELIQKVSSHARPNKVVRMFLTHVEALKALHADAETLYKFVETDKRIPQYKQARTLLRAYEETRQVLAAKVLQTPESIALAEGIRLGLREGVAGEKWPVFAQAVESLLQAYQQVYTDLHAQRQELFARLSGELVAEGLETVYLQAYSCANLAFDPAQMTCK